MSEQTSEGLRGIEKDQPSRLRDRRLLIGAIAAAGLVVIGVVVATQSRESSPASATEVATSFVAAIGALDADGATELLADDADVSQLISSVGAQDVEGTPEELRLLLSLLAATGYEQTLRSCEELGGTGSGTDVGCAVDYHNFRSDEIGRGPFEGSSYQLTVRDGEVVQAGLSFGIDEFSSQMWEPFAAWVSDAYPADVAVMYTDATQTGMQLTDESIALWEQHLGEYAESARQ